MRVKHKLSILLMLSLLSHPLAHGNDSIDTPVEPACKSTPTPSCLLNTLLQKLALEKSNTNKANRSKTETLLSELAYEAYFFNEQETFQSAISQIKKHNVSLAESLKKALTKFSRYINSNTKTGTIAPTGSFPSEKTRQLAKEDYALQKIKRKHSDVQQTLLNTDIIFSDSLQWSASNYYYLTLIRDVEVKKSIELKRELIHKLAQSPSHQHDKKNLTIALMETLGGALKQGEETRSKSKVNAFSAPELTHANTRIIFFKNFLTFYNKHLGLKKEQCNNPTDSIGNAINTFFLSENRSLIEQLDKLALNNPNDYLIAGMTLTHISNCSPLNNFYLQRYLMEISTIQSKQEAIRHLRSFRRYSARLAI